MFTKSHIIAEIKRTASENGGKPLGTARFEAETGIKTSDWLGKIWPRWGDALVEAEFKPNILQGPRDDDELLESLAILAHELGHFPVANELKLRARTQQGFPWHSTYRRFGQRHELAARLRNYAMKRGYEDVAAFCDAVVQRGGRSKTEAENAVEPGTYLGYVYLMKSGRYYKVGRSNAVGRRERELAIQLPEKAEMIHSIKTDDPVGIEKYWHTRLGERRKNGEWFELTAKDVAAFKRRKFM